MEQQCFPRHSHRADPTVPTFDDTGLRAVMDAECGLCSKGALWIARNDSAESFRIIPMQDPLGTALLKHYGIDANDPSSWLLLDDGHPYTGMSAVIRTGQHLGGLSRALGVLRLLPHGLQAWLYRRLARNRFQLAGRADMCGLPEPALQKRLLRS